jgi:hypothetical protein
VIINVSGEYTAPVFVVESHVMLNVWVLTYLHTFLSKICYELLYKVKPCHADCMKSIFISRFDGDNKLTIPDRYVRSIINITANYVRNIYIHNYNMQYILVYVLNLKVDKICYYYIFFPKLK